MEAPQDRPTLVDLNAADGGYKEWRLHHWEPTIEAGMPPPTTPAGKHVRSAAGTNNPVSLLQNIVRGPSELV